MDIYDSNGTKLEYSAVLANLPITESCEHVEELMKADHIVLSWRDSEKYTLPVGAYITHKGVNYALLEPYESEQKSDDEFEYTPNFQHPKMYLGKVPFRFPTTDTEGNSITLLEWPYSGDIDTLLTFFCRTMESVLGLTANTFNYSILGEIDMVVSTTFNTEDILSALTNVANKLKCEWHIDWDYKILYFGHIELSRDEVDETVLEVGVNVRTPSVRSSKEGFYNTYEPQGSTRNISKRAASGEYVQGDVRLALNETDYPDKVIYTNESGTVIASLPQGVKKYVKPLIFDNIFPKLDLYVYDVRCRERDLLDDNGEKIIDHYDGSTPVYKRYAVWYMRLAYATKVAGHVTQWHDYTINPEADIISGKNLGGAFQPNTYEGAESFPLAGRGQADDGGYGFELIYHSTGETIPASGDDTGVVIKAGDYEIVFQQQNDYILPTTATQGIIPKGVKVGGQEVTDLNSLTNLDDGQKGNIVDLYNIVIDNRYNESAQNDLAQETLKYIANQFKDNNSYTLKSDVVAFKKRIDQDELLHTDSSLYIGEKVIYKNGDYELETRVMKLTTKLDYAFEQEIVVGNEVLKGTQTTLKEQVQTILSGGTGSGGGIDSGAVRKIVQAYTNPRFLSKIEDDTAQGFIKMLKGLQIGSQDVEEAILGEGGLFQMGADGKVHLITDSLYVRMRAYFDSVVIREYKHESGNRIVSPAQGFNASRVEYIKVVDNVETIVENPSEADYFRCYWRIDDGEKKAENQFIIGDLAFCEHSDVVNGTLVTKRYWRVVRGRNAGNTTTADGEAWIDLSNAHDGNGNPMMTTISWTGQGGTTETLSVLSFENATNGYPEAHDDISMLGCTTDTTRQGAIIEYVSGVNAPAYQIYQGLGADATNPYLLTNKNQISLAYNSATGKAKMDVFGDAYIGDRSRNTYVEYKQGDALNPPQLNIRAKVQMTSSGSTIDGTPISQYQFYDDTAVRALISGIQDQIDGQIESWFYDYMPVDLEAQNPREPLLWVDTDHTIPCLPYKDWYDADGGGTASETDTERIKHLGDTFYDNSTGYAFRFSRNENTNAFEWVAIEDSAVITALQNAARAQATADGKCTTFLNNTSDQDESKRYPTNYRVGDSWILQVDATINGVAYKAGDILTSSANSDTYDPTHWRKQVRYTDDTKADSILGNTYYQQLAGGTINTLIGNAQSAADAANAAAVAAQQSASAANTKLANWANDGMISPTEKLALKNQKADVEKEYAQIITDAAKYSGVSTTDFTTAYNRAITAFNYYTTSSPENITIITDSDTDSDATPRYSRIAAYYAARQTILEDITSKAKKYAEDQGDKFLNDAVYKAIDAALGSQTDISGGLVLTSLIGMRHNTGTAETPSYTVWGGISGEYDDWTGTTHARGHGIAAWFGGEMHDMEDMTQQEQTAWDNLTDDQKAVSSLWAKTLFRFDGSGYLASKNIRFTADGKVYLSNIHSASGQAIDDYFFEAFAIGIEDTTRYINPAFSFSDIDIVRRSGAAYTITGTSVLNRDENDARYMVTDRFKALFRVYNGNSDITDSFFTNGLPPDTSNVSIKAMFDFWSQGGISALGQGSQGGGGGASALYQLTDVWPDDATNPTKVRGAQPGYVLTFGNDNHWYAAPTAETYVLPQATTSALGGIMIGYNDATPKTYAVALNSAGQAYVAVHYAWGDISNKPTTISGYGITDAYTKAQVDSLARLKSVALASDGVLAFELQDGSVSYADLTHQHDFQEILDKPTTLAGFGITDAKIESGVITLGGNTITPVTSVAMTVPTGFSISGTPISKIGTLTLSYSSGYEGFTTDLKNMITALYSWFEVDSNGDIKTKDYTSNGTTKHRGFWSPTFISALGQGNDGGGGGQGDVTWELLKSQATNDRYIHLSYISTALASYLAANNYIQSSAISDMATKTWVGNQGYLTQQSLSNYYTKSQVDALARLTNVAYSSDGILAFTHQDGSTTYADFTHEHSFLELLDKPTTIAGYEISDAYINNGVVYLGNNSITPVTSVAMTVPTGFSISGSPISKTGTLAVSYASGYEGFTTSLKGKIEALFSWFELDSDGNVKTKDYYDNGTIKHRGFWSESFISALGEGNDGGGGGQGDVTWELLKQADTRPINISHLTGALSGYATQSWVTSQGYVTTSGMNTAINALTYLNSVSLNNDGSVVFGGHGIENTILDLSHQHSFLELLDRPTTITGYGITDAITTSNIGSQSVSYATSAGDASTLGGTAKGGLFTSLSSASDTKLSITIGGTTKTLSTLYASYAAQLTSAVNLYIADSDATNTGAAVSFSGASNVTLKLPSTIKATLSGNATTATTAAKLSTTSKTAWGRTFWTAGGVPDSISGALESVTNIEMSGYIKIGTIYIGEDSNGNLEIYKLNNGSHVAANLYARGGVSALGQSSSGGGGGQGDVTWDLLKSSDTRQINISHLAGDANYAGVMSILTGYTTSGKNYKVQEDSNHHLYVNVPWTDNNTTYTNGTGLSLSGTTFSINSTYQTYISNGNTAYGWGNHASAGYALQTSLNALEYFNSITGGSDIITITTNKSNSTVIDLTHQHSFQELTDKPTTIAGYGITDVYSWARQSTKPSYAFSEITGTATANQIPSIQNINSFGTYVYSAQISRTANTVLAAPNGSAGVASFRSLAAADIPSLDWSKIGSGKPTTLSGYGITDACTQSTANGLLYTMSLNNDGTINVITLGGTTKYSIDFTHQHSFLELVDRPTTTDGYGITGGKMTGNLYVLGNVGIGTSSPSYKLHVNGESYFANWMFVNSSVTALGIELQPSSSSAGHGGHIDFHYNKSSADYTTRLIEDASGRLKLIGDFYATGGVTALVATSSDIRKKNVVSYDLPLTLNQIADAPTIKFTWKDNAKLGEQVGSIAQYWQKVLPQTIRTEKDDTLSLQYGVAALVATITTARKVVDHEKEIAKLKERVSALEKENELLKLKIA